MALKETISLGNFPIGYQELTEVDQLFEVKLNDDYQISVTPKKIRKVTAKKVFFEGNHNVFGDKISCSHEKINLIFIWQTTNLGAIQCDALCLAKDIGEASEKMRTISTRRIHAFKRKHGHLLSDEVKADHSLRDYLDKTLKIVKIVINEMEFRDGRTKEPGTALRIVLIDDNGAAYEAASEGIISDLIWDSFLSHKEFSWNPPIEIVPMKTKTSRGFETLSLLFGDYDENRNGSWQVTIEEDIWEDDMTSWEEYLNSYLISIRFRNQAGEVAGDLFVHFNVTGYGMEDVDSGSDVSYEIAFFKDEDGNYLEDHEAFAFIFSNYGEEVMKIVNLALEAIEEHYEKGTPLTLFEKGE